MKIICKALFLALFFIAGKTVAQDFVYTPKNPAFGGNPYNSSWLMSSAQAQNETKEKITDTGINSGYSDDPLKNFTQSLNQQILSQISRQIVSKQFGEGGLTAEIMCWAIIRFRLPPKIVG